MATPEQPTYRKAVFEARTRAREDAAALARERRRKLSVMFGLGLSFVLLGGVTGSYIALDVVSIGVAGSSVTIPLVDRAPGLLADGASGRTPARGGAVQLALADTTGLQIALPPLAPSSTPPLAPLAGLVSDPGVPAAGAETERLLLGRVLAELSDFARNPSAAEAGEALLARLNEAPLETAGGPIESDSAAPVGPTVHRAALAMPSLPNFVGLPGLEDGSQPAWQRFAVPVAGPGARPIIAIVLDDLGLNRAGTNRAIDLPAPLTLAFMTYAEGLPCMAERARRAGHELMLHMPMAPRDSAYDPGPNVLRIDLAPGELVRRLDWGLGRFEGFVGVNNHMGSRFTASPEGMAPVMAALRARGLLFLDSMTSAASVGGVMARRAGVPYAKRDVFLDNEWSDRAAIAQQFARLEAVARRNGSAVGIGHPHRATLDVLARWLPEARARGFAIVPVSAIVRHRQGLGQQYVETSG